MFEIVIRVKRWTKPTQEEKFYNYNVLIIFLQKILLIPKYLKSSKNIVPVHFNINLNLKYHDIFIFQKFN